MAKRPIFVSELTAKSYIKEIDIEFQWFPGMAPSQKQKSIRSLHTSAIALGYYPILEISSKSEIPLGVKLSAFNLKFNLGNNIYTSVESAYQGSKVFEFGGPYKDLFKLNSRDAKKDDRLFTSGKLIAFEFNDAKWNLEPLTSFYDWLYISALYQNDVLVQDIIYYKAFSDIEFNPKKQISCQARSAAYFVSLFKVNLLSHYLDSKNNFLNLYKDRPNKNDQFSLFI